MRIYVANKFHDYVAKLKLIGICSYLYNIMYVHENPQSLFSKDYVLLLEQQCCASKFRQA